MQVYKSSFLSMIGVVISLLYLFNGGSHASDTLHVLMGVSVLLCIINVTHMYLPNKRSSLLLHSAAHSVSRMHK